MDTRPVPRASASVCLAPRWTLRRGEHTHGIERTSWAARRAASASAAGAGAEAFAARPFFPPAAAFAGSRSACCFFGGALVQRPLRWLAANAALLDAVRCTLPVTLLALPAKHIANVTGRHLHIHVEDANGISRLYRVVSKSKKLDVWAGPACENTCRQASGRL